jgi:hypothetical protein
MPSDKQITMHCKRYPHYTFHANASVQRMPTTTQHLRFPMKVRVRRGQRDTLVRLDLHALLPFDNGLLCQVASIDQFSYNGRTAEIQVECLAHIAP